MSLWNKPATELTFADLDEFLNAKLPEGHRLDYKLTFPSDIGKTIAAFANTLGGMIILGLDGDKVTNEPIWPPTAGMPSVPGIADRIIQIATDSIYPPVRVSVGQMKNEHLHDHEIAVVRVDESRDAPHAVEKKRKVYVYDRTDNKNAPHVLADIDRIKYLLDRRKEIEERREAAIRHSLSRVARKLPKSEIPIRWASVIPYYPWRDMIDPRRLKDQTIPISLKFMDRGLASTWWQFQNVPDGILGIGAERTKDETNSNVALCSISSMGHVFCAALAIEARFQAGGEPDRKFIKDITIRDFIRHVARGAADFYQQTDSDITGHLLLSFGILNSYNVRTYGNDNHTSAPYPDEEFHVDHSVTAFDLFEDTSNAVQPLVDRTLYGLDFADRKIT